MIAPRDRRALSVGALAIAGAFMVTRGVPALRQWSEASVSSAREVVAEASRAEASIRAASASEDTMRARSERFVALAPALLDGANPATAGATLASLISGVAAAADAKLGSVQVRTDATPRHSSGAARRTFARVSVRASLTADVRGLSKILLALERGLTMLAVDELAVTQPEPGGDATRPEMLQVELVVGGLALVQRKAQ
jgi:hypothetical protein